MLCLIISIVFFSTCGKERAVRMRLCSCSFFLNKRNASVNTILPCKSYCEKCHASSDITPESAVEVRHHQCCYRHQSSVFVISHKSWSDISPQLSSPHWMKSVVVQSNYDCDLSDGKLNGFSEVFTEISQFWFICFWWFQSEILREGWTWQVKPVLWDRSRRCCSVEKDDDCWFDCASPRTSLRSLCNRSVFVAILNDFLIVPNCRDAAGFYKKTHQLTVCSSHLKTPV